MNHITINGSVNYMPALVQVMVVNWQQAIIWANDDKIYNTMYHHQATMNQQKDKPTNANFEVMIFQLNMDVGSMISEVRREFVLLTELT